MVESRFTRKPHMSQSTTPPATDSSGDDPIRAVDLFCGAGALSWAIVEKLEEVALEADEPTDEFIAERIELVGINHWDTAIETHKQNHPWARHYHDDIQAVNPREVFDDPEPDVTILSGGIECTHWASARGGKPVKEQKRMPAWDFLTWVQKLRPDYVLVENVPEFQQWGPIEDGEPTRSGETFEAWINALHDLGYSVDWDTLNAADYGDATSRKRLFILASRDGAPSFPEPTHSEDGEGDTEQWRTAAEIIDWSDPGGSIWTRDLDNPRVRPLKNSTMQRIAEGIRRHCDDRLKPLADALDDIGRDDVKRLRENPVPAWLAPYAAQKLDEPFLVERPAGIEQPVTPSLAKFYGTSDAADVDAPIGTITSGGNKYGLCIPSLVCQQPNPLLQSLQDSSLLLGQHSNSVARAVTDRPTTTITTGGKLQLVVTSPYLLRQQSGGIPAAAHDDPLPTVASHGAIGKVEPQPMVMPRNGAYRGLHSNPLYKPSMRPLHTVTAKNTDGYLVTPSLVRYSHGGATLTVADPMPTIATERGGVFSVSTPRPYLCPMYNGRIGQHPRTRALDRPLMTVPASKSPAGLASPALIPFIDDCQGRPLVISEPLGTQTATEKYALVVPEHYPWGLDVRYRMLQPHELMQAQGFPDDYEIAGTKTDRTEQIGNAVPVNLAKSLVESLLTDELPTLTDYLEDDPATADGSSEPSQSAVSDD